MHTVAPITAKAATAVVTGLSAINPFVGGIAAVGILLIGFGCSGIPKIIEKAMDKNSVK